MIIYPDKLKVLRKLKRFSSNEFCSEMSISRATLWGWESGKRTPSLRNIKQIADILEVSTSEFSDIADDNILLGNDLKETFLFKEIINDSLSNETINRIDLMKESLDVITDKLLHYRLILHAFMNSTDSICYVKGIDKKYISANKAFLDNLLLPPNYKVAGKIDSDFFSVSEGKKNAKLDEKVIVEGVSTTNIYGFIPGSRKTKYGLISKYPIFDAYNKVLGLLCMIIDITEKREGDERRYILEKSINSSDIGALICDSDLGKVYFGNSAMEKIHSIPFEEMNEMGGIVFAEKVYEKKDYEEFVNRANNHTLAEKKLIHTKKGQWIEGHGIDFEYKSKKFIAIFHRIKTEEKLLEDINEIVKLSIDDVRESLYIFDKEVKEIIYSNNFREKLYGYPNSKFINLKDRFWLNTCVHPDDRERMKGYDENENWPSKRVFRIIRGGDGKVRWIRARKINKKLLYNGKEVIAFFDKDITEEKKQDELFLLSIEALNLTNDGIIILNSENICIFVNERLEAKLGYPLSCFLNNNKFIETIKVGECKKLECTPDLEIMEYSIITEDKKKLNIKEKCKNIAFGDVSYKVSCLQFL